MTRHTAACGAQPPLVLVRGHLATSSFVSCALRSVTGPTDVAGTDPGVTVPSNDLGEAAAGAGGAPGKGLLYTPLPHPPARLSPSSEAALMGATAQPPAPGPSPRQPRPLPSRSRLFPSLLPRVDVKSQPQSRFSESDEIFQTHTRVQPCRQRFNQCGRFATFASD